MELTKKDYQTIVSLITELKMKDEKDYTKEERELAELFYNFKDRYEEQILKVFEDYKRRRSYIAEEYCYLIQCFPINSIDGFERLKRKFEEHYKKNKESDDMLLDEIKCILEEREAGEKFKKEQNNLNPSYINTKIIIDGMEKELDEGV